MNKKQSASVASALAELPQLDIYQLRLRFRELHGKDAPISFSKQFLNYAVAYQLQVKEYGGLGSTVKKQLAAVATTKDAGNIRMNSAPAVGTRLIRQWHGVMHEVQIVESGVLWNGKNYRSLSEVACIITGTHCSGPRFFGLRRRAKI